LTNLEDMSQGKREPFLLSIC